MLRALSSTDHKVVGLRLVLVALVFFLGGGVLALVLRTELAGPGMQVTSYEGYNALFTMHGSTMIFLVIIPVGIAICAYMVPLQIGAAGLAGARWAHAGSWLVPLGGVVMWLGWLTREGPGRAGWYAYDPLSDQPHTPGNGMDLWLVGVSLATLGTILVAASVLVTILRRRAPGMTMLRMAPFTWTALVTCLLVVFSFPTLVVAFGAVLLDRRGLLDVDPIAYQHLFWFYGHPAVYVMFFPFVGMQAEAAAAFASRRFFGYRAFVIALIAFTVLSMSVWAHHMFTTGAVPVAFFALTSTALIVPAGVEYFDTIGTLWKGRLMLKTGLLFVVAFLLQFLIGGITGVWTAAPVLDGQASDSYFVVGHFHYTIFAGSLFGFFAGLYLWWPKITGRFLPEGLGRAHFALYVVGTNLTFLPHFLLGREGMARRLPDYPAASGWETLNLLSTIGAGLIALGTLVFLLAVVVSLLGPRVAADDAWGTGNGLEWATSSPPPAHNFDALPPVRSFAPVYDLRHHATHGVESREEGGEPDHGHHEPELTHARREEARA